MKDQLEDHRTMSECSYHGTTFRSTQFSFCTKPSLLQKYTMALTCTFHKIRCRVSEYLLQNVHISVNIINHM